MNSPHLIAPKSTHNVLIMYSSMSAVVPEHHLRLAYQASFPFFLWPTILSLTPTTAAF